ncbi:MAG: glycosyltransferase [Candidatus Eremiobacteraeota bacterium]|nr:glycosyltransferase [Candidatus Eremiobacteraeota bacterium]
MKKKVCIITPRYPPFEWGGLALTVSRVARYARHGGYDVHVARLVRGGTPLVFLDESRRTEVVEGITVHTIEAGSDREPPGGWKPGDCRHTLMLMMYHDSLELLHRQERFDLIHSFFLFPAGYVGGLMARSQGIPSVVTLVGNDVHRHIFSPEKIAALRCALEWAHTVVALSSRLLSLAGTLAPLGGKSRVIHNSVEIPAEQWSPSARYGKPFRIGAAGIFKYAKGLPYLFRALSLMRERAEVTLELAGTVRPDELPVYEEALRRTGTASLVKAPVPLKREEMAPWLTALDAFVLPSLSEGCPNVLMEAMACGVPSVATEAGCNSELIEDGRSGLLVPSGDGPALAGALARLREDPEMAEKLGRGGRERMRAFTAGKEAAQWMEVYHGLCPHE